MEENEGTYSFQVYLEGFEKYLKKSPRGSLWTVPDLEKTLRSGTEQQSSGYYRENIICDAHC